MILRTNNGYAFQIDKADYLRIVEYHWWVDKKGYVKTKAKGRQIYLARLIMDAVDCGRDVFVDHISGDKLDNRKSNLRVCLPEENIRNRKLNSNNRTGYKGVSYIGRLGKYRADIRAGNGTSVYLGLYTTSKEAATAYDRAAVLLHGEFARTNHDLYKEAVAL